MIQIGLTFSDPNGRLPTEDGHPYNTWQFNFRFDLGFDLYAADSVQFLQNYGIDFNRHYRDGIDPILFGELLMSSGVVLSDDVRWIAFQGKYDFGYLIKLLTCDHLPSSQEQFFDLLHTYFPNIYDIKWLLHNVHHELEDQVNQTAAAAVSAAATSEAPSSEALAQQPSGGGGGGVLPKGQREKGLEDLAKTLGIPRVGTAHQAGSDSLLTCQVFFRLVHRHLPHVLSGVVPQSETTTATSGPSSPSRSPNKGSRGRSSSVGSDGLIIEGRQQTTAHCHLRNVLHGLGKGYIQPDRDHSQLSRASNAVSAANSSPPPPGTSAFLMGGGGPNRPALFSPIPPQVVPGGAVRNIAPPPLSGAIRFDGSGSGPPPAPITTVHD